MYWAVLGLALVVILLGLPLGNDGETMAVLDELTAFGSAFEGNRPAIEQQLLTHAKGTGAVALADVDKGDGSEGLPKMTIAEAAPPIEPLAAIELSTLSKIQALSEQSASLTIGSARAQELGEALSWRIARAVAAAEGSTHAQRDHAHAEGRARRATWRASSTRRRRAFSCATPRRR